MKEADSVLDLQLTLLIVVPTLFKTAKNIFKACSIHSLFKVKPDICRNRL